MDCCVTDFMYPMLADVYYPAIVQGEFGQIKKQWTFDRTIICNATPVGGAGQENLKPETFLQYENKLIGRTKEDLRIMSTGVKEAIGNVLITNIRSSITGLLYKETAGPRAGYGTIYELGTLEPFINPFGTVEYYKLLLRRTENQTVGD